MLTYLLMSHIILLLIKVSYESLGYTLGRTHDKPSDFWPFAGLWGANEDKFPSFERLYGLGIDIGWPARAGRKRNRFVDC